MRWRSRRFLILLLVSGVIVLLGGAGVALLYIRAHTTRLPAVLWQAPPSTFTQRDQSAIVAGFQSELSAHGSSEAANHHFSIVFAQRQGDWALFTAVERTDPGSRPNPTEPLFFIGHAHGTDWTIWLPNSPHFCEQLRHLPEALLDAADLAYFVGC